MVSPLAWMRRIWLPVGALHGHAGQVTGDVVLHKGVRGVEDPDLLAEKVVYCTTRDAPEASTAEADPPAAMLTVMPLPRFTCREPSVAYVRDMPDAVV